jgi:hypothetical protein
MRKMGWREGGEDLWEAEKRVSLEGRKRERVKWRKRRRWRVKPGTGSG